MSMIFDWLLGFMGWSLPVPDVAACITKTDAVLTAVTLTDARLTGVATTDAPLTVVTLTDARC